MFENVEIFKGKNFSSLFKDIYNNSRNKERQIKILIAELRPLVKSIGDATIIVPLIKEYLEIGVKNDEQLVKMAAIVQRACSNAGGSGEFTLSEEEKEQLMSEIEELDIKDEEKDNIEEVIVEVKNKLEETNGK